VKQMSIEEFDAVFSEVSFEWNKAEKAIKIAENIDGDVVIPSIFELRYAGRRMVEAYNQRLSKTESAVSLLKDAKFDCQRARHDAIDAATSKMTGDLDAAIRYLGASALLRFFPEFSDFYSDLSSVRGKIAISRESREERDLIYDTIQSTDLDRLSKMYIKFKTCEPLMQEAAVKETQDKEELRFLADAQVRIARRNFWIGSIIGVSGILVAIAVSVWSAS
jgi:hypothetical protein